MGNCLSSQNYNLLPNTTKLTDTNLETCEFTPSVDDVHLVKPFSRYLRKPVVTILSNTTCNPYNGMTVSLISNCIQSISCHGQMCVPQKEKPITINGGITLFQCNYHCDSYKNSVGYILLTVRRHAVKVCEIITD